MNNNKIAYIPIKNCRNCPNWFTSNACSTDGWDYMENWNCKETGKKIQGAVEWHEEGEIPIPNWCPLINKKSQNMIENKETKAKEFALKCHRKINQMYNKDLPYEFHLEKTVEIAKKYINLIPESDRDEVLAGCWIHDVYEDTGESWNNIKDALNESLAEYSFSLSNEKGRNRKEKANKKYYTEMKAYKHAAFIKLCDRIANTSFAKSQKSSMFKKYQSEQDFMKEHLYDGRYQELWDELTNILFH
jgi:hypothetical protein